MQDDQGFDALHAAVSDGQILQLLLLLCHSVRDDTIDRKGRTALQLAIATGRSSCAEALLQFREKTKLSGGMAADGILALSDIQITDGEQRRSSRRILQDKSEQSHRSWMLASCLDRRACVYGMFFAWPFILVGLVLHLLGRTTLKAFPFTAIVSCGILRLAILSLYWAPSDMQTIFRTPFLSGVLASSMFWSASRYVWNILPGMSER